MTSGQEQKHGKGTGQAHFFTLLFAAKAAGAAVIKGAG